ncbi:MAG: zinc ribbon domain-containing protein, partial [Acidobacteria bacterium]|nr:zinc ribbon domain-containing protein [Acidobacteriota bacterium]
VTSETVPCVKCGESLPAGAKFCNHCGAKQEMPKCPKCQAEAAPGTKFCNECGTKIDAGEPGQPAA